MRFLLPTLLWLVSVTLAAAGWQMTQSTRENPPNELIEHRKTVWRETETGAEATLHLALFKTSKATLQVVDQPAAPRQDLAETMARIGALAGVNGGYFDPEDKPVGLLVQAGKKITPLSSAHLLSGLLWATASRVEIVRAKHFQRNGKVREAVQCGPLLVEHGEPVAGLNATRTARRTFAAVDGKGGGALGVSSGVSLAQIGQILALPQVEGGRSFLRALNLDGGSSSAFWIGGPDHAFSLSEQKTVRDFVAIVPRRDR